MKVSVAIPCYNGAPYLTHAIEAVLAQTRSPDELLVVDDGSTDESTALARQYPVRVVNHPENRGLAAARNTALANASGELLAFVDADAFATPVWLETLVNGYEGAGNKLGGVGGQGIEANVVSLADRWRRAHASQGHGLRVKYVPFLYGLCMSFRVSALKAVGGFTEAYRTNAEDLDVGLRLNAAGYHLLYLPGAQVLHQRRDDVASLTRAMTAWYSAAYRAKCTNRAQPWTLFAGSLRRLFLDPVSDLWLRRDLAMARLSVQLTYTKLQVLWQTAQTPLTQLRP